MTRQIVLDTETTGIGDGHRIIEIGCVELIDRALTGRHFHVYINPERAVDEGAFRVHGISDDFLKDKPKFIEILDDFLEFIQQDELIIHNAPFDTGFIDTEFRIANYNKKINTKCKITDTLVLAKQKHPGQKNNLDALCKRYDIDNTHRDLHGALLDAEILALVYLAMTGGQLSLFELSNHSSNSNPNTNKSIEYPKLKSSSPILHATPEELTLHENYFD